MIVALIEIFVIVIKSWLLFWSSKCDLS